jgi:hypothetical protein
MDIDSLAASLGQDISLVIGSGNELTRLAESSARYVALNLDQRWVSPALI